jgi:predicted nuclease of predicted toxin-antitoxin system
VNERIRFHLDEPVDPVIARAEGRVIVTHDADFLRFASENSDHPGIAYCHKTRRSIGEIVRSLILIFEAMTPEEMTGRVEFL